MHFMIQLLLKRLTEVYLRSCPTWTSRVETPTCLLSSFIVKQYTENHMRKYMIQVSRIRRGTRLDLIFDATSTIGRCQTSFQVRSSTSREKMPSDIQDQVSSPGYEPCHEKVREASKTTGGVTHYSGNSDRSEKIAQIRRWLWEWLTAINGSPLYQPQYFLVITTFA